MPPTRPTRFCAGGQAAGKSEWRRGGRGLPGFPASPRLLTTPRLSASVGGRRALAIQARRRTRIRPVSDPTVTGNESLASDRRRPMEDDSICTVNGECEPGQRRLSACRPAAAGVLGDSERHQADGGTGTVTRDSPSLRDLPVPVPVPYRVTGTA